MIVLKFEKTSTSALVAHVDTLRAVTYIFRRANVAVQYSQGFNPHMELGFSAPLALGVESFCEYVSAKTDFAPDILDRLNAVCPQGIRFTKAFDKTVNLAATINRATYQIVAKGLGDVSEEITAKGYCISYSDHGQIVTKDVSTKIFGAKRVDVDTALVTLAVGNDNLRPDRLVLHLMEKYNLQGDYQITKVQSFVGEISADEYFSK